MLIFPFQSNRKGSLLCVQSELYIPCILKKKIKNIYILLHVGTHNPTTFFSFNTNHFKIKAIYLSIYLSIYIYHRSIYQFNSNLFSKNLFSHLILIEIFIYFYFLLF